MNTNRNLIEQLALLRNACAEVASGYSTTGSRMAREALEASGGIPPTRTEIAAHARQWLLDNYQGKTVDEIAWGLFSSIVTYEKESEQ